MTDNRSVPSANCVQVGQVGQQRKTGTSGGTDTGTPDWEALISRHLRRDSERDSSRDALSHTHGTAAGQVGRKTAVSDDCRFCQFDGDCAPQGTIPACLRCGEEIAPNCGCMPCVIGGTAGRMHMACFAEFRDSLGAISMRKKGTS